MRVRHQIGPPPHPRPAPHQRPLRPPVQVLRDLDQLLVPGEGQHGPVEPPVGLRVGRAAAGGRRADRRLGEGTQLGPALRRHRPGQPQHHRHLDQRPHLGQLRQLPRPPLDHPEPTVRHDLDGTLDGQLLHRFPHRCRGDPEPLAQHRSRVHLPGPEVPGHQRGPQRVHDLPAHRGPLNDGPAPRSGRRSGRRGGLTVRVLPPDHFGSPAAPGPHPARIGHPGLLRHPHLPALPTRRPRPRHLRPGGALRALLHGSAPPPDVSVLGVITAGCYSSVKHHKRTGRQFKSRRSWVR
jgi:hypothetical protein